MAQQTTLHSEMPSSPDPTRERLLDSAGEVFAEKGFKAATVREICARAEVNVAAVNYHFGDKERLYMEAVSAAHCGSDSLPGWPEEMSPAERLRYFIHGMLHRLLASGRPNWHAKLMMRELADPTAACAALVEAYIKPMSDLLRAILVDLLPADVSDETLHMTEFSIVGQCLFYKVNAPVARLLIGEEKFSQLTVEPAAEHIARFTLAALGHDPTVLGSLPAAASASEI